MLMSEVCENLIFRVTWGSFQLHSLVGLRRYGGIPLEICWKTYGVCKKSNDYWKPHNYATVVQFLTYLKSVMSLFKNRRAGKDNTYVEWYNTDCRNVKKEKFKL